MGNVPAFRLYPSEEVRLRREVEKLSYENNELLDRIFELEQALKPFAAIADIFDLRGGNRPTTGMICQWEDHRVGARDLTVEMVRTARAALATTARGKEMA